MRPKLDNSACMANGETYSLENRRFIVQKLTNSLVIVAGNNPVAVESTNVVAGRLESKIHKPQRTRSEYPRMIGKAFDDVIFIIAFNLAFGINTDSNEAMVETGLVAFDN